jgi:NAD(P)-dependent dehydrogenase (short-subunit alcohol dehydrogenase family)
MGVLEDLFDVQGKVALVTGAGSGLGYAFASVLAAAGAHVVVADVDAERASKAVTALSGSGAGSASPAVLDVSDRSEVEALADDVVAAHGRLDIAFANAGIARGTPPLVESGSADAFGIDDYDALIDVNLHGVVYTVRAAARHMKRQRSGSIVATASTAGLRNDPFVPYSYAIAKAGVINLVKQAAHDLARWNVRVNAIAPGPFKTNLGGGGPMSPEAEARWNSVIPLGRMGDPAEIRGLALLLASDASSFMTGGVYPIDGGALLQGPSLPPAT